MKTYNSPQLRAFGSVEELTKASFNSSASDSLFLNGVLIGTLNGSLDACVVAGDPTDPNTNCGTNP